MAEGIINAMLEDCSVAVKFSAMAVKDLKGYDQKSCELIIALIVKRALNGPLIRPKGLAKPLRKELSGFSSIKPKALNLRIICRPVELKNKVLMEIIAIGARDKDLVYRRAAHRLYEFEKEML